MDELAEKLHKFPFVPIAFLALGYFAYDYYSFKTDPASPLVGVQNQIDGTRAENQQLQARVQQAEGFIAALDGKRNELKSLTSELAEMRASLSEEIDVPQLIKLFATEAKKVGLIVTSIKPGTERKREYYTEIPFEVKFQGYYVQLMTFLERISNVQRIVRIDNFEIRSGTQASDRFIQLNGNLEILAYRYLGSHADEIGRGKTP